MNVDGLGMGMKKNVLCASGVCGCVGETSSDTSSLLRRFKSSSHRNIHTGATRSFASSATLGGGDTTTYPSKKEPDVTEFTKLRDAVFAKAMANYTAHGGEVAVFKKKRRKRGKYNQRGEMHKKVHVILREKVEQLGDPYEKVTVAAGFMRNYLFPRGHAIYATKLNEAWAEQMREQTSTEVDASSAPASKATTQPGATTTLPRNLRKTIVKRLTNPLIFVRSVDLTDRRTLDKPITRGELVEACRSAMSLEVDPLSLIYVPGHDETKAQEVPSPTAELEQLVMTTAGYHEFKIDWGEAHAQADSPMKLMIVIEPTKEQQATFDAEDAARAEFGAE